VKGHLSRILYITFIVVRSFEARGEEGIAVRLEGDGEARLRGEKVE
jgi:hypothetical protein